MTINQIKDSKLSSKISLFNDCEDVLEKKSVMNLLVKNQKKDNLKNKSVGYSQKSKDKNSLKSMINGQNQSIQNLFTCVEIDQNKTQFQ